MHKADNESYFRTGDMDNNIFSGIKIVLNKNSGNKY